MDKSKLGINNDYKEMIVKGGREMISSGSKGMFCSGKGCLDISSGKECRNTAADLTGRYCSNAGLC